ncbi:endoribonuclease L-PSP [Bacillus freudenreichii]|nr:endoribonuclease L-PSP [Bacillus freudenreichii]
MLSGQASIDEHGKIIGVNDFEQQAKQTFANLDKLLKEAGSNLQQIIKVTIYLTDMSYFPKVVELRKKYFTPPYPADTIVEVKSLALPELMIEIDAVALVNGEKIDI